MRNFIVLYLLFITSSLTAQDKYFEMEIYSTEKNGAAFKPVGSYTVIQKKGSIDELYILTKNWINETWPVPQENIVSDTEGKYLKVAHWTDEIRVPRKSGHYHLVKYFIDFKFQEGKIKMEVVDLYGYKSPNEFRDGLFERIKGITYRGRNARLIKHGARAYDELSELLDSFARSLDNYENTGVDKIESDW